MVPLPAVLSVLWISLLQTSALGTPADVSRLRVGAPAPIVELDLGKLKGELRQIAWSPDLATLYVQTAEGRPPSEKLHHYTVAVDVGAIAPAADRPDWAASFWAFKSDRFAPGLESLIIDVQQSLETMKYGTGSAGAIDQADRATGGATTSAMNADRAALSDRNHVVRLKLLDEVVSEFVNEPAVPGRMFAWGPARSGAIAHTDRDGRLFLFDQNHHRQNVSGAHDAVLPAWSTDGTRLAWAQKVGRRKYTLVASTITRG
jgi:hypothetical protein